MLFWVPLPDVPSTLVHVSLGLIIGAAVLGGRFDLRPAILIVVLTALPDIDVFIEPVLSGAHRSVGHTILLPVVIIAILSSGWLDRWLSTWDGSNGKPTAFVAVGCMFAAGIVPDLLVGGINLFYPIHDQFYTVKGRLFYSTDRGWVQTFFEQQRSQTEPPRTTANFDFRTVLDAEPTIGANSDQGGSQRVERIFPVAMSGFRAWLIPVAVSITAIRLMRPE